MSIPDFYVPDDSTLQDKYLDWAAQLIPFYDECRPEVADGQHAYDDPEKRKNAILVITGKFSSFPS